MQRKIWTQMKELFLAMQSKMLEAQSDFNWESSFAKKYTDTQLTTIQEKVAELEKSFNEGISALQEAIESPAADLDEDSEEPTKYTVTVNKGTGSGNYEEGATVTITADVAEEGQEFERWTVDAGDVSLTEETTETATFTMPAKAVTVTATYKPATE